MTTEGDFPKRPPPSGPPPTEPATSDPPPLSVSPNDSTCFYPPPVSPGPSTPDSPASDAEASSNRSPPTPQHEQLGFTLQDGCCEETVWAEQTDAAESSNGQTVHATSTNRYRLLDRLGQGGFSEVYLAVDQTLSRQVAIKLPRPGVLFTEKMRARFLFEARAAAQMDHPNVVPVYDSGWYGDSGYIVYAYCSGPDLKTWIAQNGRRLDPEQAAEILLQLCRGVAHAHSRGILHRDVKPSNVLLEPVGPSAADNSTSVHSSLPFIPRVSDFGLARLLHVDAHRTVEGAVLGTLSYMSPEQAAGDVAQVSTATDVYGLGTVLYELLTGAAPFAAAEHEDLLQLLTRIQTTPPERPRRRRPDVPKDLESICLKCLEKDPADRYATVDALAEDLTRFLDGQPVLARPASLLRRLAVWARRYPSFVSALLLLVLATAAVLVGLLYHTASLSQLADRLKRANAAAQQARRVAEQREAELLHQLYAADVEQAHWAWKAGDVRQYQTLLNRYRPGGRGPDLRTLPWYYLAGLGGVPSQWVRLEKDQPYGLDFAPSGDWLAAAGRRSLVHLWHARSLTQHRTFPTGQQAVLDLVFSPDGTELATAGQDGTVGLWNPQTGQRRRTLLADMADACVQVAYSPDGRWLAAAGARSGLALWQTRTGRLTARLQPGQPVRALQFTPDSRLLTAVTQDRLLVWDVTAARPQLQHQVRWTERLQALAVSPDGRYVALGGRRGTVRLHDLAAQKLVAETRLVGAVQTLAFSPDNAVLAAGDRSGTVRVWRLSGLAERGRLKAVRTWAAHLGRVIHLAFSPDSQRLASVGTDGALHLWQRWDTTARRVLVEPTGWTAETLPDAAGPSATASTQSTPSRPDAPATHSAASADAAPGRPNSGYFAAVRSARTPLGLTDVALVPGTHQAVLVGPAVPPTLLDVDSGRALRRFQPSGRRAWWAVAVSSDGRWLAAAETELHRRETTDRPASGRPATGSVPGPTNSDEPAVEPAGDDSEARQAQNEAVEQPAEPERLVVWVWSLSEVRPRFRTSWSGSGPAETARRVRLAFSPQGRWLAVAVPTAPAQTLRVVDLATGQTQDVQPDGPSQAVAFGPVRRGLCLAAAVDGNLHVFQTASWKLVARSDGHDEPVNELAFCPNGRWLATGADDRRVLLWPLPQLNQPVELLGHRGRVHALAFTADGTTLLSGDSTGCLILWDLRTRRPALKTRDFPAGIRKLDVSKDNQHVLVLTNNPHNALFVLDVPCRLGAGRLSSSSPLLEDNLRFCNQRGRRRAASALWESVERGGDARSLSTNSRDGRSGRSAAHSNSGGTFP